jgi:hypothetical protein
VVRRSAEATETREGSAVLNGMCNAQWHNGHCEHP